MSVSVYVCVCVGGGGRGIEKRRLLKRCVCYSIKSFIEGEVLYYRRGLRELI